MSQKLTDILKEAREIDSMGYEKLRDNRSEKYVRLRESHDYLKIKKHAQIYSI